MSFVIKYLGKWEWADSVWSESVWTRRRVCVISCSFLQSQLRWQTVENSLSIFYNLSWPLDSLDISREEKWEYMKERIWSRTFQSNNILLLVVNIGCQFKARTRDAEFRLLISALHGYYHHFKNHYALKVRPDVELLFSLLCGNIKQFIHLTE